jgi:hypothetical protein
MSKEVQIVELSPDQIQQMLNTQAQLTEKAVLEQKAQSEAMEQAILNMTPSEISDYLSDHLSQSSVIIEATNIVSEFNLHDAIFIAALNRTRNGLDAALSWIENHFSLNELQAEDTKNENETESPKQQKQGKRIVYGKNSKSNTADESEQL